MGVRPTQRPPRTTRHPGPCMIIIRPFLNAHDSSIILSTSCDPYTQCSLAAHSWTGTSSAVAPCFAHHSLLAILNHFILLHKSANLHTARQTPLVFCSPSASCLAKMFGSMSRHMVGNERIFKYRQQAAWHKCLNYCTDKWYAANGFSIPLATCLGRMFGSLFRRPAVDPFARRVTGFPTP